MWPHASRAQAQKLGGWRSVPPCAWPRERAWVESGELCPQGRCSRGGHGQGALSLLRSPGSCLQSLAAQGNRSSPSYLEGPGLSPLSLLHTGGLPLLHLVYVLRWRGARMINAAAFLAKLLFGTQRHCCALHCHWTVGFWSPGSHRRAGQDGPPGSSGPLQARQPAVAAIAGAA